MAIETERKFLLKDDSWTKDVEKKTLLVQAYLSKGSGRTVRVRIAGDEAFITIKGKAPAERPLDTPEFEYSIPPDDAKDLLKLCLPGEISKIRHHVRHEEHLWEIDVFQGANEGLIVAEIELKDADEAFSKPGWLGEEVTFDHRYKNAALSDKPFSAWGKNPPPPDHAKLGKGTF